MKKPTKKSVYKTEATKSMSPQDKFKAMLAAKKKGKMTKKGKK